MNRMLRILFKRVCYVTSMGYMNKCGQNMYTYSYSMMQHVGLFRCFIERRESAGKLLSSKLPGTAVVCWYIFGVYLRHYTTSGAFLILPWTSGGKYSEEYYRAILILSAFLVVVTLFNFQLSTRRMNDFLEAPWSHQSTSLVPPSTCFRLYPGYIVV